MVAHISRQLDHPTVRRDRPQRDEPATSRVATTKLLRQSNVCAKFYFCALVASRLASKRRTSFAWLQTKASAIESPTFRLI